MLIDGHIHYDYPGDPKKILRALEITNADYACIESQIDSRKINQNIDALYAKLVCEGKVYVDGALDAYLYFHHDKMDMMPKYIENLRKCGIDGIKMIEGKPCDRKRFPIPNFDDPLYDPTFSYLEKEGINITWHVNDPEEFWDEEKVPFWAKRSGWFYGDGTFANNIDQYNQVENLLKKHPNLKITFAHFFFLSNNLKHLSELFDKYPNISVDITPGIELFTNMSDNIVPAKQFFNKYSDRILYGTDISIETAFTGDLDEEDAKTRKELCHAFLSENKHTIKGNPKGLLGSEDITLNCLGLSEEKIEEIEYKNLLRLYPKLNDVNVKALLEEIKKHREKLIELKLDYKFLDELEEKIKEYDK